MNSRVGERTSSQKMNLLRYVTVFFSGVMVAAVLAVSVIAISSGSGDDPAPDADVVAEGSGTPPPGSPDTGSDVSNQDGECLSAAQVYELVRPSVVEIDVAVVTETAFGQQQSTATGTGFVVDEDGHILTNNHVVADAESISVVFSDGDVIDAVLLGTDPANDLAVIRVDPLDHDVVPIDLGDSGELRVGDPVLAIGNPFNLAGTLTQGIVSGLNRTHATGFNTRPIRDMIQTDAAINPGNSGGPLLNCRGEVIGINTLLENPTGDRVNVGVGFAVSVNTALSELDQLIAGEPIRHAWLGIAGMNVTPAFSDGLGLGVDSGVYVTLVTPGSPAAAAGLIGAFGDETDAQLAEEPPPGGDVIVAVDGGDVETIDELATVLDQQYSPGDRVELTVVRDGGETAVEATLADWPG